MSDQKSDEDRAKHAAYIREYRKKNPDKVRAIGRKADKARKERDPALYAAKQAERQKRYHDRKKLTMTPEERARKKAAQAIRSKKWYESNIEKHRAESREKGRRAYAKDPTRYAATLHRRRSGHDTGDVTLEEWEGIKARYGNRCAYCLTGNVKLTMDHVVPLKKDGTGGRHEPGNVVPACNSCNRRKGTRRIAPVPPLYPERGSS